MKKYLFTLIIAALFLTACTSFGMGGMMGDGGMMDNSSMPMHDEMESQIMGMMSEEHMQAMNARHNTAVPDEYAGLTNPIEADQESIQRGQQLYTTYCTVCHGETGLGDGLAGETLSPPPSPIGLSSQMIGEDYWFWRVSEGGIPFETSMPAWKDILAEQDIWDLLNYVRTLNN